MSGSTSSIEGTLPEEWRDLACYTCQHVARGLRSVEFVANGSKAYEAIEPIVLCVDDLHFSAEDRVDPEYVDEEYVFVRLQHLVVDTPYLSVLFDDLSAGRAMRYVEGVWTPEPYVEEG